MTPRRAALLGGLAAVVLYGLIAAATGAGIVDDTYIFLRYARNIWEGAGAVFNDGDRVEGYTSPLWLAVLTALQTLRTDPPVTAVAASAIAGGAAIAVLLYSRRTRGLDGAVAAIFLASNPSFVFWSWSGMDTALFTLLVILVALGLERDIEEGRRGLSTGLLLAGAALTRLDALWLVPALIVLRARRTARSGWWFALLAPCAMALAALLLWRHGYYGTWLPNTFAAKLGVPRGVLALNGLRYLGLAALTYTPLILVLWFIARRAPKSTAQALLVPAVCAVWLIVFVLVVGGDHFPLVRFMVPAIGVGSIAVGRLAVAWTRTNEPRRLAAIIGTLVLAHLAAVAGAQGDRARSEVKQAEAWAKTGRWCATALPPGSIASLVVGAIPYYCDRPTIDLLGLVDRHIATSGDIYAAGPPGHQKYDTAYVLERSPRFIFFPSSGQPARPLFETVEGRRQWLDDHAHALRDLATAPETLRRYEYRNARLTDGTFVEWLERK